MDTVLVTYVAALFAAWPMMARYAAVQGTWNTMLIGLGTFIATFVPMLFTQAQMTTARPHASYTLMAFLALAAGIVNGLGINAYGKLYTGLNPALAVAAVFVLMIVFSTLGARIFFKDTMNAWHVAGIFSAFVTIWLLKHA